MKKIMTASVLGLICTLTFAQAQAAEWTWKKGAAVGSAAIAGAALGGPVGFVVGVAAGDYLGDQVNQADQLNAVQSDLTVAQQETEQLRIALHNAQVAIHQYETLALDTLQQDILFRTAGDAPDERANRRLQALVSYLSVNPTVKVRLDGYADPRGADEYNLGLSQRRVDAVRRFLQDAGIHEDRISVNAYGDRLSKAEKGDADAYVLERVVTIELTGGSEYESVAVY